LIELVEVGTSGFADAVGFILAAATTGRGAVTAKFFGLTLPVSVFAPSREPVGFAQSGGEDDALAGTVKCQVQVGGKVDVGFKRVTVDFYSVTVVFFFE
jgi:hypothetical protein